MATGIQLATSFPTSWSTSQSEQYFSERGRVPHFRFYVSRPDGHTWEDLTEYLTYAQVDLGSILRYGETTGIDEVIREAEFELAHDRQMVPVWDSDLVGDTEDVVGNDTDVVGDENDDAALLINLLFNTDHQWLGNSFHPLDRRSNWNQFNGQYAPLLFSRRECIFEVAMAPIGEIPSEFDYEQLIHGVLGDGIENVGSGVVRFRVRDKAKYLTDDYVTPKTYGSAEGTPVETVIRQILIDNGWASIANDMWVPISPGWMVYEHPVEYVSVWDAIQNEIKPTGWFLGFRYRPSAGKIVLTLLEPPRQKTPSQYDFRITTEDEVVTQTLKISDADIRNRITVVFRNSATGQRESITVEDLDSQAVFGVRPMQVEEDDTSLIDTEEEATAFAMRMLWDLRDLRGTTRVECRLLPSLDIFDGVVVDDPRIFSEPQFFGVETVRHEFDMRTDQHRYRTHFIGSGRVIGGHSKWLEMETRPGIKPPIRRGEIKTEAIDPDRLAGPLTPDYQSVIIDKSKNAVVIRDESGAVRSVFGNIQGYEWGSGLLQPGTYGMWGDQAGIYLRGYARFLRWGYAEDEEPIDLSNEPNLANPDILVAPKEFMIYHPSDPSAVPIISTEVVQTSPGVFVIKAKLKLRGQYQSFPTGNTTGDTRKGTWVQPQVADVQGRKGVTTNFFRCRVYWFCQFGATVRIWQDVTNQFDSNGDPINWETVRSFKREAPIFSGIEGKLNWDLSRPLDTWAIRVRWDNINPLITNARTEMSSAGYRTDGYLDMEGNTIDADDPSGMSVMYIAYDQG